MPMPNRKLGNSPIEPLIWSVVCSLSQSTVHHILEDCRWTDYTDTWPNKWFKVTKGLLKYILCAPQALKNITPIQGLKYLLLTLPNINLGCKTILGPAPIQLWMCIRWLHTFTSLLLLHCIPPTFKIGTEYIWFVRHITMGYLSTCSASSGCTWLHNIVLLFCSLRSGISCSP